MPKKEPGSRRPGFLAALPVSLAIGVFLAAFAFPPVAPASLARRQMAFQYYQEAVELRSRIEALPEAERVPQQYKKAIDAFRRVYRISPQSSKADDSLLAIAEIYTQMSVRFGAVPYRDKAAETYRFLIQEYPYSPFVKQARKVLKEWGVPEAEQAAPAVEDLAGRPAIAKAAALEPAADRAPIGDDLRPVARPAPGSGRAAAPRSSSAPAELSLVSGVRHWSFPGLTRVIVDLDAEVPLRSDRLENPERLYFDLENAKLSPLLIGKSFAVNDELVSRIRMAQTQAKVTRVVVDLKGNPEHSVSLLPNPPRVVVELRDRTASGSPSTAPLAAQSPSPVELSPLRPARPAAPTSPGAVGNVGPPAGNAPGAQGPARVIAHWVELDKQGHPIGESPATAKKEDAGAASAKINPAAGPVRAPALFAKANAPDREAPAAPAPEKARALTAELESRTAEIDRDSALSSRGAQPPNLKPPASPPASKPSEAPRHGGAADLKAPGAGSETSLAAAPPTAAMPDSRGERDLIRTLGLKVARVVIDAGHGGHDTGTIGPTGLMEKELTLDIATRLGALVAERIGSDVVFTRSDDTFVPLEERTALANQKQADLFISIHANSSRAPAARGIETYYLNLTGDREAMAVAARENAASQKTIHDLQDLVSKITLTEKISESREFAGRVQQSLYSSLLRNNATLRDRGVRKAPFVVLIGAHMPSVLAEVSFLSNPRDERLLKSSAYRQKIAEALFSGISAYARTLSRMEVAAR